MNMLSILPIISLLVYLIPFVLVIWFAITLIKLQKERNGLLRRIAETMDRKEDDR